MFHLFFGVFRCPPCCLYSIPSVALLDPTGEAERVQASGVAADQLQTLEDEEFFVGVKIYQNTREHGLNLAIFGKKMGGCCVSGGLNE